MNAALAKLNPSKGQLEANLMLLVDAVALAIAFDQLKHRDVFIADLRQRAPFALELVDEQVARYKVARGTNSTARHAAGDSIFFTGSYSEIFGGAAFQNFESVRHASEGVAVSL